MKKDRCVCTYISWILSHERIPDKIPQIYSRTNRKKKLKGENMLETYIRTAHTVLNQKYYKFESLLGDMDDLNHIIN